MKGENSAPERKGFRERILDCLTLQVNTDNNSRKKECIENGEISEGTGANQKFKTDFAQVWNNYRYKKWGDVADLPPIEELEKAMRVFCVSLKLAALEKYLGLTVIE